MSSVLRNRPDSPTVELVLAITDLAAEAISTLTSDAQLPPGGGLRISANELDSSLSLALAAAPAEADVVLEGEGVVVFLDPVAAEVLDDKVLDVQRVDTDTGQQELRFAIGLQEPGEPGPT